jgi:hypothetical protein
MPQATAAFVAFLKSGTTAAAIVKAALYVAVSYGVSKVLNRVPGQERGSKIETERNTAAPRKFILGKTRMGGVFGYYGASGLQNKHFQMIVLLAGHECDGIDEVYFNDELVTFDGSDIADSFPYEGVARLQFFDGSDNQQSPADLITDTATQARGRWTTTERLRGICHMYLRLEYDEAYEERIPSVSAVLRGAKMYDPRKDSTEGGSGSHRKDDPTTWEWSDNSALCLAWYLTYPRVRGGYGLPWERIDLPSLVTAANICDESVNGKPRYTCNGVVDTSMAPGAIIQQIAASMAGGIIWPEGIANIYAGAYVAPILQLDEDDLLTDISIVTSRPIADSVNEVLASYIEPSARYALVDMPPVRDEVLFTVSGFNDATEVITLSTTHGLAEGDRVQFRPAVSGNALPFGLTVGLWYYVRNPSGATLQVAIDDGGTVVGFTGGATGSFDLAYDRGYSLDGQRFIRNLKLDMVEDVAQAQRLASIELKRNRQAIACQLLCNIEALQLLPNDAVRVLLNRYGWWSIIASTDQAFTADAATDTLTCAAAPTNGTAIVVSSDDALPAPLAPNTVYYVRNRTATTFQVSRSRGGDIINLTTSAPTGNHELNEVRGKEFEVLAVKQQMDGNPPTPVVALDLLSTDATVWADPAVAATAPTLDLLNLPGPLDSSSREILAPQIEWIEPPTDFYDFTGSGSFDLDVNATDANGDLVALRIDLIDATTGALATAVTNQTFPPTALRNYSNGPNTHGGGTYQIVVTATDAAGNVTAAKRTVTNTAGGVLIPPTLDPPLADFATTLAVDIDVVAPADRIEWATTAVGGAEPTTGITLVVALTTTVNLTSSRRLWARAGDGVDWSAWVFSDYFRVGGA